MLRFYKKKLNDIRERDLTANCKYDNIFVKKTYDVLCRAEQATILCHGTNL